MTNGELRSVYLEYLSNHTLDGSPSELYEPANYILSLSGKRIRPLLCLRSFLLFDEDLTKVLPLAHAMEVFHNFTLMHDDVIDRAPLRRGMPTVHHKWDVNRAILSGDMMLIRSYQLLTQLQTDQETKLAILNDFNQMAEEVCVGQQMDVNFSDGIPITEADYTEMIRLKTSVLLGFCLKAGARLGGVDGEKCNQLYQYGIQTGIGFQIMDDYLDAFGSPEVGKQVGGDIIENKQTLLIIELKKRASAEDFDGIERYMTHTDFDPETKVGSFLEWFEKYEIKTFIQGRMKAYFEEAGHILSGLETLYSKEELLQLSEDLRARQV